MLRPNRITGPHGEAIIVAINLKPVDVAVVGLGAAGGVAVLPLARAGLRVAGIEAGTWMDPAKDFHPDEIYNNVRGMVTTGDKIRREAPTFRTDPIQKARQGGPSPMMNAIGGTSIHYHAQSWRLKPWDFKTVSEVKKRYGAGYLPKGSTLEDWPIAYGELEPYYDTVEYEIGSAAKRGISKACSTRPAMSMKVRAGASIRCRRFVPPIIWSA